MTSAYVHINIKRGKGNIILLEKKFVEADNREKFDELLFSLVDKYEERFGDNISYKLSKFDDVVEYEEEEEVFEEEPDDEEIEYVVESKKSIDFQYARDAIEYIDEHDVDDDFLAEEEDRVTVIRAFENKK